jgi:coenzyme F420-reducing hydrogenase gamma subunit
MIGAGSSPAQRVSLPAFTERRRPRVAVHKFSSCDGCQLALLNLGEGLLALAAQVDFVHFAEMGPVDEDAEVDIAIVEGSVSTPHEIERIAKIRRQSKYLIAIGACATSGGIQALRNLADAPEWTRAIYASPEHIHSLDRAEPLSAHARIDLELWGCPVSARQVLGALRDLLSGVTPVQDRDKVCVECKRIGVVCVLVAKGLPCMGPVTTTGCGVLCPQQGRDCYGCFGPAERANGAALAAQFAALGLSGRDVARRFGSINSHAEAFAPLAQGLTRE